MSGELWIQVAKTQAQIDNQSIHPWLLKDWTGPGRLGAQVIVLKLVANNLFEDDTLCFFLLSKLIFISPFYSFKITKVKVAWSKSLGFLHGRHLVTPPLASITVCEHLLWQLSLSLLVWGYFSSLQKENNSGGLSARHRFLMMFMLWATRTIGKPSACTRGGGFSGMFTIIILLCCRGHL